MFLILNGPNSVIKSHIVTASSVEYHVSLKALCHLLSFPFLKIISPPLEQANRLCPPAIILENMKQVFERRKLALFPSFQTIFQQTLILRLCCIVLHSLQDHSPRVYSDCVPWLWLLILCYFEAHSISSSCPTKTNMKNIQIKPLYLSGYGFLYLSWMLQISGLVHGFKRSLTHAYQQCRK